MTIENTEEVEETTEIEELELETTEVETTEEVEDLEKETPLWMQENEDAEEGETVPVGALMKKADKIKALRGKLEESDDEKEQLKKRVAELEKGAVTPTGRPKRPRNADFDTDEEHEEALEKYEEELLDWKLKSTNQVQSQNEKVQQKQQRINEEVSDHFVRAAELVEKNGIKPDVYKKADEKIRHAAEMVMPKAGAIVVDSLISVLGSGSEKVMFYLGRNETALNKFTSLLQEDPSGLKVAAFLGETKRQISGKTKQTSRAPAPAANINGDAPAKPSALKKKYDAAHKKGSVGEAFKFKRQAKKAGVDTSNW